ncbi:MAG: hypothetical protein R3B70_42240 [Polyangiaceae bacterium]
MNVTSMNARYRQAEELFQRLEKSSEGAVRSNLLLQLIDVLHTLIQGSTLFYPWRRATPRERETGGAEAVAQRRIARRALEDVLCDGFLSFEMRLLVARHLIDEHVDVTRELAILDIEDGMSAGHLDLIHSRVEALHMTTGPAAKSTPPPPLLDAPAKPASASEDYAEAA